MSSTWKPDDSVIEGKPGTQRIKAALDKHHVDVKGGKVTTSRDPGAEQLRHSLRRPDMPPGIQSWQLPIMLENCPVFFFITVVEPGAVVPLHSHKRDLFRWVMSGSIITNGIELKPGDWMFVPAGVEYGYTAGFSPSAVVGHCYG